MRTTVVLIARAYRGQPQRAAAIARAHQPASRGPMGARLLSENGRAPANGGATQGGGGRTSGSSGGGGGGVHRADGAAAASHQGAHEAGQGAKSRAPAGSWGFAEQSWRHASEAETSTTQRLQEGLHLLSARSHHQREELLRLFKQTLDARSRRLTAAVLGAVLTVGGIVFFNRHRAREVVKDELSHAASGMLGDEKMQLQTTALTLQTLQALLEDPGTQRRSVEFIAALSADATTRAALMGLLVAALKEPAVLQEALTLTLWVLDRDDTREHFVNALVAALKTGEEHQPNQPSL